MNIKILDCTLRDGGFVNDWNFGKYSINNIFARLLKSNIDIIEIGMLNDKREFDINRTICPRTEDFNKIITVECKTLSEIVAMVILGECDIKNIGLCCDTIIDGIRIVFKKSDIEKGYQYASAVKERGYKIYIQPASVTDYSASELIQMINRFSNLEPEAIYIVDTYGLIEKKELLEIFNVFKCNLPKSIAIGYHAHNNLNIAYSNTVELMSISEDCNLFVDTSVYGMGKNAGNTNTELVIDFINRNIEEKYDLSQVLEVLEQEIKKIKDKFEWGYSFKHFISGTNRCHPQYVEKLLGKNTLSINHVNKILSKIDKNLKTTFNAQLLDKLYDEYISEFSVDESDLNKFQSLIKNREILIICPGSSIVNEREKIDKFINENNPLIIGANFVTDLENLTMDVAFFSNNKRYNQANYIKNNKFKIVATSNIYDSLDNVDYYINFADVACSSKKIITNASIVLMKTLVKLGIQQVSVAGFDGYNFDGLKNYSDEFTDFKQELELNELNFLIMKELFALQKEIKINYITNSIFNI